MITVCLSLVMSDTEVKLLLIFFNVSLFLSAGARRLIVIRFESFKCLRVLWNYCVVLNSNNSNVQLKSSLSSDVYYFTFKSHILEF